MENKPLIVGAGPTGLAAALFLASRGVAARIIDSAPAPEKQSRALVVNPRTLELLESSGVANSIISQGRSIRRTRFYVDWDLIAELDLSEAHPHYKMTALLQAETEALLAAALAEHGIQPERGVAFKSLKQDGEGVTATLKHADGKRETTRASFLLGADGAHSRVREALGVNFEGSAFPEAWPLFDLELNDPLEMDAAHVSFIKGGLVFMLGLTPGFWRVFADVARPLDHLPIGSVYGEAMWQSTFRISHRVAAREAIGRVALAGDAAHIHSPVAARGMNLGIEDAYVFAECALRALGGDVSQIEAYGRQRHEVHTKVVARIKTLTAFARGRPDIVGALRRYLIPGMTKFPPTAHPMVQLLTGLDHEVEME